MYRIWGVVTNVDEWLKMISISKDCNPLQAELIETIEKFRIPSWPMEIKPLLEPRYQLSLEIIFDLYLMVFERIDIQNGKFTTEELNPTPEETKKRVYDLIMNFEIT